MSDKEEEKEYRQNNDEIIEWLEKNYHTSGIFFTKQAYLMQILRKILVDLQYVKVEVNELTDDINNSKNQ